MLDLLLSIDTALFLQLNSLPHPDWLTSVMRLASLASDGAFIWILSGITLAWKGRLHGAWRLILALAVTFTVVDFCLKPMIGRDRPFETHKGIEIRAPSPTNASFPSGHAAVAGTAAFAISCAWRHVSLTVWILALLVATSRVYLGTHYPLDVIGGLVVGVACAYFVTGGIKYDNR